MAAPSLKDWTKEDYNTAARALRSILNGVTQLPGTSDRDGFRQLVAVVPRDTTQLWAVVDFLETRRGKKV